MIWLVGNRGMLGTEVEALLARRGTEFVATDTDCDITDIGALRDFAAKHQPRILVNCSAYTAVDQAEDDQETAFAINATGVEQIAVTAREIGASVLHVSTDYVFDGDATEPYPPETPTHPLSVYGMSKAEGEKRLRATTEKHIIVRTAWLYGRHGRNFVSTMLRLFAEKDEITVDDDQHGSPTYAIDLARAIISIADEVAPESALPQGRSFGTFHYTNGGATTWFEFAREIQRLAIDLGIVSERCTIRPIPARDYPTKATRPAFSLLDTSSTEKTFGISIPGWKDGIRRFLADWATYSRA